MERLRHGAEIGLETACERGRDAQRRRRPGEIELHEMAGRRSGSKNAERRGRMPTLVVVMKIDSARQPDLDLDTDHVSGNEVFAGSAAVLSQRKQRRYQRRRMMA